MAFGAVDDLVLAGLGDHHELVRVLTADGPAVGLDEQCRQPAAGIDILVGLEHPVVATGEPFFIGIKAVEVLHGELADPEQAGSGAGLVAELGLNLVEEQGQVAVAPDILADQLGNNLFVGRPETQVAVSTVAQGKQPLTEGLVSPSFLPQLQRLEDGHHQLLPPGRVHLLPDDILYLFECPPGQGQVGVHAGGYLSYHAGPQQ